jgi:putative ABC transport system permease protein
VRILLRIFNESVALAMRELRVNKLRTILTLLGISIGIFCVISIFSSVDSLENNLRTGIDKLGNDVIYINKFPWGPEEGDTEYAWWRYWNRPYATYDEMKRVHENVVCRSNRYCYLDERSIEKCRSQCKQFYH